MNARAERKFIGTTTERFSLWCEQHKESPSNENFLIWLMKHNFVTDTTAKRAFVVEEVNAIRHCRNVTKTDAVIMVEDEYGIPERTCYQILKEHSKTFR